MKAYVFVSTVINYVVFEICESHQTFRCSCVIDQRFSNYGPRTTYGPRGLSLWSFRKDRRKNKIQMISIIASHSTLSNKKGI